MAKRVVWWTWVGIACIVLVFVLFFRLLLLFLDWLDRMANEDEEQKRGPRSRRPPGRGDGGL